MTDTNETHPDWILLARIATGTAGEQDLVQLERWVGGNPERRQFVESVRTLWQDAGSPATAVDVDDALARIKGLRPPRRRVLRFPGAADVENSRGWRRTIVVSARVAVAAGVIAATAFWFHGQRNATDNAAARISEIRTRRAERAELRLPDGTRLVLGPASSVRYTSDYGIRRREVVLEGQALFVVAHDGQRPFVVRTPRTVTTDLGTTFVVRDYEEVRVAEVMVAEGKVAVAQSANGKAPDGRAHPATTLEAGDLGAIAPDGRVRVQHDVSPDPYVAWSQGRLVFDDTPLSDVLGQIRRWYDVDAQVADSITARRRLTASYSTESLADVLPLIAASLDLRVERHGRAIVFHPKGGVAHSRSP